MSWGVYKDDALVFETEVKSDAYAEGFHLGAFKWDRGKARLQPGWKVREVTDGSRPISTRDERDRDHQKHVRTEEGGRVGRVVQGSQKDHPVDPEHEG